MLFDSRFEEELLALMAIDTVTPMETGMAAAIGEANAAFADAARRVGMEIVFDGPGELPSDMPVPVMVARRAAAQADFLVSQPHMVLSWGNGPAEKTVMFNFHMDTVSPHLPVKSEDGVLYGRGAVDNKGPAVAILAALAALERQQPDIKLGLRVLIQSVAGEEGGAMGVYGSRWLAAQGYLGRLNVYVEPTDGTWIDVSTTSMTAEVVFAGLGSTDDFPEHGHNATVALAYIAAGMATVLADPLRRLGVKMTVAGLHTGLQHNRVYGKGGLLFNFAYTDLAQSRTARGLIEAAFSNVGQRFTREFAKLHPFSLTAREFADVCRLVWLKYDLPVLNNRDTKLEAVLAGCGLHRNTDPSQAFTCDAMWGQGQGRYSIVLGPGSLSRNGAHTEREYVTRPELEGFCALTVRLLKALAALD